jgi:uracil-DNA glycosylase
MTKINDFISAKSYSYKSWNNNTNIDIKNLPLDTKWKTNLFDELFEMPEFDILNEYLNEEKHQYEIFPYPDLLYNAFNYTSYDDIKVVILGQDPYPNFEFYNNELIPNAMGLSFSVPYDNPIPSSLRNIFKNLNKFNHLYDYKFPKHGNLQSWASQGCLMLNTSLTVRQGKPNSHSFYWCNITDRIISHLSDNKENIAFVLWGNPALSKKKLIDETKHKVFVSSHPSGLSCNNKLKEYPAFVEYNVFYEINKYLKDVNKIPILWQL